MKKRRIIYAVNGMMEYQTIVRIGRNNTKVCFTGGSISNGCTQPARYITTNIIMQNAIEACEDFKCGRIRRERVITLKEDIVIEKNPPKKGVMELVTKAALSNGTAPRCGEDSGEDCGESAGMSVTKAALSNGTAPRVEEVTDGISEEDDPEISEESGLEVVDASCKDVAKQYLQEHYNENPTPLRTRADVQRCAAKYGITFNFV